MFIITRYRRDSTSSWKLYILLLVAINILDYLQIDALVGDVLVTNESYSNNYTYSSNVQRRLKKREISEASDFPFLQRSTDVAGTNKMKRLLKVITKIETKAPFYNTADEKLIPESWGSQHNFNGPHVIFTVNLLVYGSTWDAEKFVGTARKAGYNGDIVIAIPSGCNEGFINVFKRTKTIVYIVDVDCEKSAEGCIYRSAKQPSTQKMSINMIRFQLYQYWASLYDMSTMIMLADFNDLLFQSNPFTYKPEQWFPPVSQLAVFQESFPNKAIYRCPFNRGWVESCYGTEALNQIGLNTVSCSGVSIGTRNAILAYTYLMNRQVDPKVRWGGDPPKNANKKCLSLGIDQGFHNWLVYSGILSRIMDIAVFKQGEGPINTLGALYPGEKALLKFNLSEWRILRGEGNDKKFYNWNGDISPVVHQFDRFEQDLVSEFKGGINKHLAVFKGIIMR